MKVLLPLLLVLSLTTACGAGAVPQTVAASVQPPPVTAPETPEEAAPVPVRTVDLSRPMVALTFDDGPHAEYTDQILDILEEHNAVATFFEVAANLSRDPDAVRRAAEMGCEIGSHSYRHANLGKMKLEDLQADLAAADAAFVDVLGTAPTLLRPPYGSTNKALKTACDRVIVTWSIDPEDWKSRDADKVAAHIQSFENLDGQVILLHSTYESTVEATRTLVPWLEEQGYHLVTVSELITHRFRDTLDVNRLYNFDYFRFQVPPLSASSDSHPVANMTIAQGNTGLGDGSAATVKLVMTQGTYLTQAAGEQGGGYGPENWTGRCELQVWKNGKQLSASTITGEPGNDNLLFNSTGFPLRFDDYNGDGAPDFTVGQWLSSNLNAYTLYTVEETGAIRPLFPTLEILSTDGKSDGPYSAQFVRTAKGFSVSVYDNTSGESHQVDYLWSPESGQFVLAA